MQLGREPSSSPRAHVLAAALAAAAAAHRHPDPIVALSPFWGAPVGVLLADAQAAGVADALRATVGPAATAALGAVTLAHLVARVPAARRVALLDLGCDKVPVSGAHAGP